MATRDVKILFVGDMHLGTQPSRVPGDAAASGALGPAAAWRLTVDAALRHGVRAVALAGDVVNRENELFEARRPLEEGLLRLRDAGIAVYAVAGNHDTATLPTLAEHGGALTLLGARGAWERQPVADGVDLVGWSFPAAHWPHSPFASPPPPPRPGTVTLGLLHADLDGGDSVYAPAGTAEFAAAGYSAWFLGHIHTPGEPAIDGRPFYLGSLTPLDPSETGAHGPVLVTVGAAGGLTAERLPLAPLRWERWDVPCDGLAAPHEDLLNVLMAEIGRRAGPDAPDLPAGQALGLRLTLTGEVDAPLALQKAADALADEPLETTIAGRRVFVDRVACSVRARVDLTDLARGRDPAALLARRILALQDGGDTALRAAALERARAAVADIDGLPGCRMLDDPLNENDLRDVALRAAHRLLARLLADQGARA